MSLEINAQYARFVQFAQMQRNAEKSKAIARIDDTSALLDGRAIKAADNDTVAPLFKRSEGKKNANEAARTLFLQSIANIFGGEARIPPAVKATMLLKDYGEGKPLTARRIIAVKRAVDDVFRRVKPALEQAKANAALAGLYGAGMNDPNPELRRNRADALLETLVKATAGDPDALEVAVAKGKFFIVRGDAEFRSAESIQAKADNLLAAVAELKAAAKGDLRILEIGKTFLKSMNGKDVPAGFIRDVVNAVKELRLNALKDLSPSSPGPALHAAVREAWDGIGKVLADTDARIKLDGGADEMTASRNFALSLMLARCSVSNARKIASALVGEKAGTLAALYNLASQGSFAKEGMSEGMIERVEMQSMKMSGFLATLNDAVQARLGVQPDNFLQIPEVPHPNYGTIGPGEIFRSLKDMAMAAAEAEKIEFAKGAVAGEGELADKIRDRYMRFGEPQEVNLEIKLAENRSSIVKSMLNGSLCKECKMFAEGKTGTTQFALDLARDLSVTLPGGRKLTKDFNTARDELASFVTGGAKASYEALNDKEKGKVHVLMSLCNQHSTTALQGGEFCSLDPEGRTSPIMFVSPTLAGAYSVSFKQDGTLSITCNLTADHMTSMIIYGSNGEEDYETVNINPATKIEMTFRLEIKADEFERLASLDYSKCDPGAIDRMIADPTVKNPNAKYGDVLGEYAFRRDGNNVWCSSTSKITVA